MKKETLIITVLLCGLLCSCSSLQTGLVSDSASSAKLQLPYYLPKGLITIDVTYKDESIPVITSSLTYIADENVPRLYAQYTNNIFSKDTIDIKTDSEGLLTNTIGQSEDKSLIVIENLALAALEVGKIIYGVPSGMKAALPGKEIQRKPKKLEEIHITVDPTNQDELEKANSALSGSGLVLREGLKLDKSNKDSYKAINISFDSDRKYSGLLFRPLRFYRLYQVIKKKENEEVKNENGKVVRDKKGNVVTKERVEEKLIVSFAVPDPTQHYCVPLMRRAFVASITKLEIEKGMLKGVHIEKGSEAEAISGLPLRLVKEVVSLPQGILIYQSDQIQAETKLIEAQTNQIKALQALEKARQETQ
jgi:hypothetical protein